MKSLVINIGRVVLNIIYSFMKISPAKDKVVFISRQGNEPSLDFRMLAEELESMGVETVTLCRKLEGGLGGALSYCFHMLRQMRSMATSKAVVLDSYCIAASLLHHREGLQIVQMWHALGGMKKFGLSILDMPEGKSSAIAIPMRMHRGYTQVFTSSNLCRPAFAEAFGYAPEMLTVMSLPRVDAILDIKRDEKLREKIYTDYPQLDNDKKTILYIPTHRMEGDMSGAISRLVESVDYDKYDLVIKVHPLTKFEMGAAIGIVLDHKYESIDMMAAADYVITDYSAMTYEAALKGLPIFFYAYDKDEYLSGRTFYIDYEKEMPGPICTEAEQVMKAIDECDVEAAKAVSRAFADRYIEKQAGCTREMAQFIRNIM